MYLFVLYMATPSYVAMVYQLRPIRTFFLFICQYRGFMFVYKIIDILVSISVDEKQQCHIDHFHQSSYL